jgi:hypothetical protein
MISLVLIYRWGLRRRTRDYKRGRLSGGSRVGFELLKIKRGR